MGGSITKLLGGVAPYLRFNGRGVQVSVLSGEVAVEDVGVDPEKLNELPAMKQLPVVLLDGRLGSLKLRVKFARARVELEARDVYLLLAPNEKEPGDVELDVLKQARLLADEILRRSFLAPADGGDGAAEAGPLLSSLVAFAVGSVRVSVQRVHRPVAIGAVVERLSLLTGGPDARPVAATDAGPAPSLHGPAIAYKDLRIDGVSGYVEPLPPPGSSPVRPAPPWPSERPVGTVIEPFSIHCLASLDAGALLGNLPLDPARGAVGLRIDIDSLEATLDPEQAAGLMRALRFFEAPDFFALRGALRPRSPPHASPREWFVYAARMVRWGVARRRAPWSWAFQAARRQLRAEYAPLWRGHLAEGEPLAPPPRLAEIEAQLSYEEVVLFRDFAETHGDPEGAPAPAAPSQRPSEVLGTAASAGPPSARAPSRAPSHRDLLEAFDDPEAPALQRALSILLSDAKAFSARCPGAVGAGAADPQAARWHAAAAATAAAHWRSRGASSGPRGGSAELEGPALVTGSARIGCVAMVLRLGRAPIARAEAGGLSCALRLGGRVGRPLGDLVLSARLASLLIVDASPARAHRSPPRSSPAGPTTSPSPLRPPPGHAAERRRRRRRARSGRDGPASDGAALARRASRRNALAAGRRCRRTSASSASSSVSPRAPAAPAGASPSSSTAVCAASPSPSAPPRPAPPRSSFFRRRRPGALPPAQVLMPLAGDLTEYFTRMLDLTPVAADRELATVRSHSAVTSRARAAVERADVAGAFEGLPPFGHAPPEAVEIRVDLVAGPFYAAWENGASAMLEGAAGRYGPSSGVAWIESVQLRGELVDAAAAQLAVATGVPLYSMLSLRAEGVGAAVGSGPWALLPGKGPLLEPFSMSAEVWSSATKMQEAVRGRVSPVRLAVSPKRINPALSIAKAVVEAPLPGMEAPPSAAAQQPAGKPGAAAGPSSAPASSPAGDAAGHSAGGSSSLVLVDVTLEGVEVEMRHDRDEHDYARPLLKATAKVPKWTLAAANGCVDVQLEVALSAFCFHGDTYVYEPVLERMELACVARIDPEPLGPPRVALSVSSKSVLLNVNPNIVSVAASTAVLLARVIFENAAVTALSGCLPSRHLYVGPELAPPGQEGKELVAPGPPGEAAEAEKAWRAYEVELELLRPERRALVPAGSHRLVNRLGVALYFLLSYEPSWADQRVASAKQGAVDRNALTRVAARAECLIKGSEPGGRPRLLQLFLRSHGGHFEEVRGRVPVGVAGRYALPVPSVRHSDDATLESPLFGTKGGLAILVDVRFEGDLGGTLLAVSSALALVNRCPVPIEVRVSGSDGHEDADWWSDEETDPLRPRTPGAPRDGSARPLDVEHGSGPDLAPPPLNRAGGRGRRPEARQFFSVLGVRPSAEDSGVFAGSSLRGAPAPSASPTPAPPERRDPRALPWSIPVPVLLARGYLSLRPYAPGLEMEWSAPLPLVAAERADKMRRMTSRRDGELFCLYTRGVGVAHLRNVAGGVPRGVAHVHLCAPFSLRNRTPYELALVLTVGGVERGAGRVPPGRKLAVFVDDAELASLAASVAIVDGERFPTATLGPPVRVGRYREASRAGCVLAPIGGGACVALFVVTRSEGQLGRASLPDRVGGTIGAVVSTTRKAALVLPYLLVNRTAEPLLAYDARSKGVAPLSIAPGGSAPFPILAEGTRGVGGAIHAARLCLARPAEMEGLESRVSFSRPLALDGNDATLVIPPPKGADADHARRDEVSRVEYRSGEEVGVWVDPPSLAWIGTGSALTRRALVLPKWVVTNRSGPPLVARSVLYDDADVAPSLHLQPGETHVWRWPGEGRRALQLRLAGDNLSHWSPPVPVSKADLIVLQLRDAAGAPAALLAIYIELQGPCLHVFFDREETAPFRVSNHLPVEIEVWQEGEEAAGRLVVGARKWQPFCWDNPRPEGGALPAICLRVPPLFGSGQPSEVAIRKPTRLGAVTFPGERERGGPCVRAQIEAKGSQRVLRVAAEASPAGSAPRARPLPRFGSFVGGVAAGLSYLEGAAAQASSAAPAPRSLGWAARRAPSERPE
eukprot:tig00020816_g14125.t1